MKKNNFLIINIILICTFIISCDHSQKSKSTFDKLSREADDSREKMIKKQIHEIFIDVTENWYMWKPEIKVYFEQDKRRTQDNQIKKNLLNEVFKRDKYSDIEEGFQKLENPMGVDYVVWINLYWHDIKIEEGNIGYDVIISILFVHDDEYGWNHELKCTFQYLPFTYVDKK